MDFDYDTSYFQDTTAWIIGVILYFIFMAMIWLVPSFGSGWDNYMWMKYVITVLALPTCYIVAKWRLDRG